VRRLLQKRTFPVNIHFTKKSRIFSRGSGLGTILFFNHPYGQLGGLYHKRLQR